MVKKYYLFIIVCTVSCLAHAQDDKRKSIGELLQTLKNSGNNINRCNTLLDLALGYILKPGEYAHDLDSANLLIRQAEGINKESFNSKAVEAKIYFTYANLFREKGERDKGKSFCEKSIAVYKNLPVTDALGEAYFELANYYEWSDVKERLLKKEAFGDALAAFKATDNKSKQGFALKNIADMDVNMRNYGQALVELQQALDIYKSINYPQLQGVYDLLGNVYNRLGDYPSAVKYGLLAVKTCDAVNDTSLQRCTIYYRLSISYENWNRSHSPEALTYQEKAFEIANKYNDAQSMMITLTSLSINLAQSGRKKEAVALLLKYKDRIIMKDRFDSIFVYGHFLQTFKLAEDKPHAKDVADIMVNLLPLVAGPINPTVGFGYLTVITYFIWQRKPDLAVKYARLNLALCTADPQTKTPYVLAYRYMSEADSAAGDFASAYKNHRIYADLKDSLFNETKSFQFTQMQAAFETQQKDDELKILQATNKLNNIAIEKARQIRNSIIIAAIILLALFYIGYRFKQRSNTRLQKKQDEINQQNEILKNNIGEKNQLLSEKEWLVKEIHHRVKNNLQIVISLLNTQSHYINNEEAIAAITESRHRMEAMSLIHQKLYQSDNTTSVNMKSYIHELTEYLEVSFATDDKITFTLAVDPIEIDIAQAIPLGLILNETITNSIKYAFAKEEHGIIKISLHSRENDDIMLEINDNGSGLPNDFDIYKSNSMGMRLILGLAKQIEGTLMITGQSGVTTTILFKQHFITAEV